MFGYFERIELRYTVRANPCVYHECDGSDIWYSQPVQSRRDNAMKKWKDRCTKETDIADSGLNGYWGI